MTAPTGGDALRALREALAAAVPDWARLCDDEPLRLAAELLPVVLRYGRDKAAAELETLAFRLVSQDVQDEAVYDEIGSLRAALTAADPT